MPYCIVYIYLVSEEMNSTSHRLSFKSSFSYMYFLLYVHIYYEFKINTFKPITSKNEIEITPNVPKIENGHFQLIRMETSIRQMSLVMRKPAFYICENKDADQLRGNREADQRLCFFATRIVQSLYFLNPKFQASSHLL